MMNGGTSGDVMKRFLLTAAILALSANAAVAADALPPSDYDWSGFSAGVFGGGQWSSFDETELHTDAFGGGWWFPPGPNPGFDYNDSAAMFGVQAGFDRQFDRLVLGLGLEAGHMNIDVETTDPNTPPNPDAEGEIDIKLSGGTFGSLTARAGLAFDRLLIYGRGGVSIMGLHASTTDLCDEDFCGNLAIEAKGRDTLFGLTAGAGIEYALTDNITAGAEYRLYKFEDMTVKGVANNLLDYSQTISPGIINTVRVSVNFKF